MKLVEFVPPTPHPLWKLCPQMGITDVIVKVNPDLTGLSDPWKYETLSSIVSRLKSAGLNKDIPPPPALVDLLRRRVS